MKHGDYYQLLGVARDASPEALRRAFRARVLECHPDLNPNDSSAQRRTQEIVEAYRVLSDRGSRWSYDLATRSGPVSITLVGRSRRAGSAPVPRAVMVALALVLVGIWVLTFVQSILGQGVPVYRPDLSALDYETGSPETLAAALGVRVNVANRPPDIAAPPPLSVPADASLVAAQPRAWLVLPDASRWW